MVEGREPVITRGYAFLSSECLPACQRICCSNIKHGCVTHSYLLDTTLSLLFGSHQIGR